MNLTLKLQSYNIAIEVIQTIDETIIKQKQRMVDNYS